jgi:hypothetical protein
MHAQGLVKLVFFSYFTYLSCKKYFRNLREARDNALAEKDRAVHAEQQITSRYEQVSQE